MKQLKLFAATAAVAVAVAVSLGLFGISGHDRDAGIACVVIANLAWLPVTGRWMARARLCLASSIFLAVSLDLFASLGLPSRSQRAAMRRKVRASSPGRSRSSGWR